jgi:glutathione S-transferase
MTPGAGEFELCWYPGSCSRVSLIALEEVGVPFTTRLVDLLAGEQDGPEYRRLNPKGKVPTLLVAGRPLSENPAILTYLDRRVPTPRLLPAAGEWEAIEALSLISWFAAGIHPALSRFRNPLASCRDAACADPVRTVAGRQLEDAFAILESRLGTRDSLFENWSIVDGYMSWLWFRAVGSGMDAAPFPRCAEAVAATESRPSVARALDREEREWAALRAAGGEPPGHPPNQAGRLVATGPTDPS